MRMRARRIATNRQPTTPARSVRALTPQGAPLLEREFFRQGEGDRACVLNHEQRRDRRRSSASRR
jgi:hypothetical protein